MPCTSGENNPYYKHGLSGTSEYRRSIHKQYYEQNREKVLLRQKQYREQHREKIALRHNQYREKNREKIALYKKQNKEKIALYNKQWRERKKLEILEGIASER